MSYQPLIQYLPKIAEAETRVIHLTGPGKYPKIPRNQYALIEFFCTDKDCDCRRVMWVVEEAKKREVVAVIAYGWANAKFYQDWFGRTDKSIVKEMQGPNLNRGSPQSEYATAILEMVVETCIQDTKYMDRVKKHYTQFRRKLSGG